MDLKFSTCFYLFLIITNNLLFLSNGAAASNDKNPLLQKTDIIIGNKSQVKVSDTFVASELLTKIKSLGLLSSKYETNYFMEMVIRFLVRYLSFIVNFSAIFNNTKYNFIYKRVGNIVTYLESRSSYYGRRKMLFRSNINELSGYINRIVNIELFSSLSANSKNISKQTISNIVNVSKDLVNVIKQITTMLQELSLLDVDLTLKHMSKFLNKLSDDCLRVFNNCILRYSKMSKSQLDSLFASKMKTIINSNLLDKLNAESDHLEDMKVNFEKIIQKIQSYNQFLETGEPEFTDSEIQEVKSLIKNLFENGNLDETTIFRKEEIVLVSFEFLGLAAINLSLFDESHLKLKDEIEETRESAISIINHRGTEIRLSQTVVFAIREEIRRLMKFQEFLRLDFTVMNLDKSLLKEETLYIMSRFYESLLSTFEFVKKEQSINNCGKYILTIFSKLDLLFEKTLDAYKNAVSNFKHAQDKSKKTSASIKSRTGKRSINKILTKKVLNINNKKKLKVKSGSKYTKTTNKTRRKNINQLKNLTSKKRRVSNVQSSKKSERRLKAQVLSEMTKLLRVAKIMKSQLNYLIKANRTNVVSIVESVLEVLNEILFSEGLLHRANTLESNSFSSIILGLRSIGDRTCNESLFLENNIDASDSERKIVQEKSKMTEHCSGHSSALISKEKQKSGSEDAASSNKSLGSHRSRKKASEQVRPLAQIRPTIELFGENPVFATRQNSKNIRPHVTCSVSKKKVMSRTLQKYNREETKSNKTTSDKTPLVGSSQHKRTISDNALNKSHTSISKKPIVHRRQRNQSGSINKKLIDNKSLLMLPPKIFDDEILNSMVIRYQIKFLDFSHISAKSSRDSISQAIHFCYNQIGYLFFEIFPFISGIESVILKQIIMQTIILFKELVSILILKDIRRADSLKRNVI